MNHSGEVGLQKREYNACFLRFAPARGGAGIFLPGNFHFGPINSLQKTLLTTCMCVCVCFYATKRAMSVTSIQ